MTSRAVLRVAAVAGALAAALVAGGPASARPAAEIPADVRAAFSDDAVRRMLPGDEPGTDLDGAQAGDPHEVFALTDGFVDGERAAEPARTTSRWIAGIGREGQVLGVLYVEKPPGVPAELVGFSTDADLGAALATLSPTEILIEDAPHGAFYALDGTTVRPVTHWARDVLPQPAPLARFQDAVAEQHAAAARQTDGMVEDEGGQLIGVVVGVPAIFAVWFGAVVLLERRRDQSSTRQEPTTE